MKVFQLANQEATRSNHDHVGTEHILSGLFKEGSGVAACVLRNLGLNLYRIRTGVEVFVLSVPEMMILANLPTTANFKKIIEQAEEEASKLSHNYIGTEHILLALTQLPDCTAAKVLVHLGLSLDDIRAEVMNLLGFEDENADPEIEFTAANLLKSLLVAIGKTAEDLPELITLLSNDCPTRRQIEAVLRCHYGTGYRKK